MRSFLHGEFYGDRFVLRDLRHVGYTHIHYVSFLVNFYKEKHMSPDARTCK